MNDNFGGFDSSDNWDYFDNTKDNKRELFYARNGKRIQEISTQHKNLIWDTTKKVFVDMNTNQEVLVWIYIEKVSLLWWDVKKIIEDIVGTTYPETEDQEYIPFFQYKGNNNQEETFKIPAITELTGNRSGVIFPIDIIDHDLYRIDPSELDNFYLCINDSKFNLKLKKSTFFQPQIIQEIQRKKYPTLMDTDL